MHSVLYYYVADDAVVRIVSVLSVCTVQTD